MIISVLQLKSSMVLASHYYNYSFFNLLHITTLIFFKLFAQFKNLNSFGDFKTKL